MIDTTTRDGLAFALATVTGYAFMPLFTKFIYAYTDLQPFDVTGWRFLGGVPLIWLMLWLHTRLRRRPSPVPMRGRWVFMGLGVLLAVGALCISFGLSYVDASLYVVIMRTQPAMVMTLSAVFLGEQIPGRGWVALGMVMVGIVLVKPEIFALTVGRSDMIGIGIGLFHSLIISLYNMGQQRFSYAGVSRAHATAWTMTGTLAVLLPVWLFSGFDAPTNPAGTFNILGLVLLCTVLPIFGMYQAVSRLGASRYALVASVGPVMSIGLAFLLLGERLIWVQVIGGVLVLASVPVLELKQWPLGWRWRPGSKQIEAHKLG